ADRAGRRTPRKSMDKRVIDERQQHHSRHASGTRQVSYLYMERNSVTEMRAHDRDVRADQIYFLSQRRRRFTQMRQRSAQVDDQIAEHSTARRRITFIQVPYLRERIEQKLRLDPRLQHLQTRLERTSLRLG